MNQVPPPMIGTLMRGVEQLLDAQSVLQMRTIETEKTGPLTDKHFDNGYND